MKKIIIGGVLAITVLSGCVSVGSNADKLNPAYTYENIKKNKTTKDEVIALFGHPDRITEAGKNQEIWTYYAKDGLSIFDLAQDAMSASSTYNPKAAQALRAASKNSDKLAAKSSRQLDIRFSGQKAISYQLK